MGRNHIPSNVVSMTGSDSSAADRAASAPALCPDHFDEKAVAVWNRIAPALALLGRLNPLFIDAVGEYCQTIVEYNELYKFIKTKSYSYETIGRNGAQQKSWPEVAQFNETRRNLARLRSEFGLTPAADKGLLAGQGELQFENPFAEF